MLFLLKFFLFFVFLINQAFFFLRFLFQKKTRLTLNAKGVVNAWKVFKLYQSFRHQDVFLFHVASSGEFEQARVLFSEIKKAYPTIKIFVSLYSSSGLEAVSQNSLVDAFYLTPIEFQFLHYLFFQQVQLKAIFFIRYDIWPGLFHAAQNVSAQTFLLCAVKELSRETLWGKIFRRCVSEMLFQDFDHIFPVNSESFCYFKNLNLRTSSPTWDLKWIAAQSRIKNQKTLLQKHDVFLKKLKKLFLMIQKPKGLFSSPHQAEIDILLQLVQAKKGPFFLVLHSKSEEAHLKQSFQRILNIKLIFFSEKFIFPSNGFSLEDLSKTVFLCDVYGWLSEFYSFFDYAVVGGGFDGQVHNALEPALQGLKIFMGPQHQKAPEIAFLIDSKQLSISLSQNDLIEQISKFTKSSKDLILNFDFENEIKDSTSKILHSYESY
jgi:3-deoxy-D-manno-octulosonic-acid transferase